MHLEQLSINRFRSCLSTTVHFHPALTVLVGENNGGKSNILDAIRLLTKPLNGRRDRYADDTDVRRSVEPHTFVIEGEFAGLSPTIKGLLIAAVPDPASDRALVGCKYEARSGTRPRGRFSHLVGPLQGSPEEGSLELIRHVFLPALRDANQALGSAGALRVMALLHQFLPQEEEADFLTALRRDTSPTAALTRMNCDIDDALKSLTTGVRSQSAAVGFGVERVEDIARELSFRLGDSDDALGDIRSSGLGYANLLYMATVVVELAKAQDADLTLFLVEEPEAHLHPQLQRLVLDFLLEKANASLVRTVGAGVPEGRIQVVVTTHSPNLTAWVSPAHLSVVRSVAEDPPLGASTKCVPVGRLGLADEVLRKISRYLDVTRSALMFGQRTMFVEGMAEALLIPILARKKVFMHDADSLARFRGALVVPIDGVDFRPYVEILLTAFEGVRIADRVVVVTDGDPHLDGNRKEDLEDWARGASASGALAVFTNSHTLEHELFLAGNEAVLKQVFLKLRPRSVHRWESDIEALGAAERPLAFVRLLKSCDVRKGDFAQVLADCVERDEPFNVPAYLTDAIKALSR